MPAPKKTVCGGCGHTCSAFYDQRPRLIRDLSCGDKRVYLSLKVRRVNCWRCGNVKTERLDWLSELPGYTKRFAFLVGRRCHDTPVKAVAEELGLDWHTVKELDKLYMREQLRRAPPANPTVIGIDEIFIGKGQKYRIVVSDLILGRPIWFGGKDRSEASLDEFYTWLGPEKSKEIRLAVMDMWKAFRNSTRKKGNAPQARILYDKYHVVSHLQKAMDQVRKSEYARLKGRDRQFIKGQRYTLLSHKRNLSLQGRRSLKVLLAANQRLNTAYVLKEQFEQLWEYKTAAGARRFFERWRDALKWQRLKPFQKFAAMVEKNWDGIVAHCDAENHVMLGFVEGFNNKIRAIQRRAFGIRDEEYLRLKILSSMLPKIDE